MFLHHKRCSKTGRFISKPKEEFNSSSPLYHLYYNLKRRCYSKGTRHYKNYGGRGITICAKWLEDRNSFYVWAMANGYKKGLQIDRKDNDKGYTPGNCHFVCREDNNAKRRITRHVIIYGEYFESVGEAAEKHSVSYDTIMYWCGEHNIKYKAREGCRCIRPYSGDSND